MEIKIEKYIEVKESNIRSFTVREVQKYIEENGYIDDTITGSDNVFDTITFEKIIKEIKRIRKDEDSKSQWDYCFSTEEEVTDIENMACDIAIKVREMFKKKYNYFEHNVGENKRVIYYNSDNEFTDWKQLKEHFKIENVFVNEG